MDDSNDSRDERNLPQSSGSDTITSQTHTSRNVEALIRKHVKLAIKSYGSPAKNSTATAKSRLPQHTSTESNSPTISDVSPAVANTSAADWHLNGTTSVTRSTTGASSRPSPPSSRDEQSGYPFPLTTAPERPIPPRPKRGHVQLGSNMSDIPEKLNPKRLISRSSGVPPTYMLAPPTSAPDWASAASSDGQSSESGHTSTSFVANKPYGQDELDVVSTKSRPSGETWDEDASSDIIHEPDIPGEKSDPAVPASHDPPNIRDSIQTLSQEPVQIETAVQCSSFGRGARPVLKDVQSSDIVPDSATSSQYTNPRHYSGRLSQLAIPGEENRYQTRSPWSQTEYEPLVVPSASQLSVSPVDGILTGSLGREPSDTSMMRPTASSRGPSPIVQPNSHFSSRVGGPPKPDKDERSASRTSNLSNPFKDHNNIPVDAPKVGGESKYLGSVTTTNALIKESLKRATDMNKSKSSSGLLDSEKEKRSTERSGCERPADPQGLRLLHQDQPVGRSESSLQYHISSQYKGEADDFYNRQTQRKCCGLPLWASILIVVVVILIIAIAVIVPVAVVVIPKQNHAAPVSPTSTSAAQQIATCESVLPCQNGGVSVLTASGGCACECANDWNGPSCTQPTSNSCTTFDIAGVPDASVGVSIPPILDIAESRYDIPLNASALISLFSSSYLTCDTEDALVTFQGVSSRSAETAPGLENYESDPPMPAMTPFPRFVDFRIVGRRQTATVDGLIIAVSSVSPTPTVASVVMTSTSTSDPTSYTSSPLYSSHSRHTLEYAGAIVLYILQLTGGISQATTAQSNFQSFFTSGAQEVQGSGFVDLGNSFTVDLAERELYYNGQQIPG